MRSIFISRPVVLKQVRQPASGGPHHFTNSCQSQRCPWQAWNATLEEEKGNAPLFCSYARYGWAQSKAVSGPLASRQPSFWLCRPLAFVIFRCRLGQ
jgi:hypothetical protein